jgi:hypothetical protein
VSTALFDVRERNFLITTRDPRTAPRPSKAVGTSSEIGIADRQLAAIRKYAPSKAQSTSRDVIHIGEVNALMRRWKPCPKAVG